MRVKSYLFTILSLNLIFSIDSTLAQTSSSESALQLIRNQKKPIVIDSVSLNRYESAFIPALADSIAEQDLVVTTQASAPVDYKFDPDWINLSLKGGTRKLDQSSASPDKEKLRGPAFGTFEQIQAEDTDALTKARKLLWNVIATQEANRFLDLKINLSWTIQNGANPTKINARLVTAYPGIMQQGSAVALREKLEVLEPDWLSTLQFLTIRQYGKNDDLLWIFSPKLSTSRELSGSLRSDKLFDTLLSLDDLFIFSGKSELLEPNLSSTFETLVPFAVSSASDNSGTSKDPNCQDLSTPSQENNNPLTSIYFAPRKVFALELKQRDPYSQIGRQKLYVDLATMLPFFKEVYSQDGKLSKSILGVFSMIDVMKVGPDTEQQQETHFIPKSVLAFGKPGEITVLQQKSGRICLQTPSDIAAKFFDPSSLGGSNVQNVAPQKSLPTTNKTPSAH